MSDFPVKFNWDRETNSEVILFRRMKWDDCVQLYKSTDNAQLKKIYFKYYYKFDNKNRIFWKTILEISDEEIDRFANKRFGKSSGFRDF